MQLDGFKYGNLILMILFYINNLFAHSLNGFQILLSQRNWLAFIAF